MGRSDVSNVGVVRRLAGQQADAGRAADGDGAEVFAVVGALLDKVLLDVGHVVDGAELLVLVVGEDEDDVGLARLHSPGNDGRGAKRQRRQRRQAGNRQHDDDDDDDAAAASAVSLVSENKQPELDVQARRTGCRGAPPLRLARRDMERFLYAVRYFTIAGNPSSRTRSN